MNIHWIIITTQAENIVSRISSDNNNYRSVDYGDLSINLKDLVPI